MIDSENTYHPDKYDHVIAISMADVLIQVTRREILYRKGLEKPIFTDSKSIAWKHDLLEMSQQSLIAELEWMGEVDLAMMAVELGSKGEV